jgi:outer membrane lipoprotein SlyB
MMKRTFSKISIFINIVVLILFFIITGCASSRSGHVYSRDQARKIQTVRMGTVKSVRNVLIEGTKSGIGAVAGGVTGGALGSAVGKGSGKRIATVAGAVAGGLAGAAAEDSLTKKEGIEITVELDDGEVIAIVQEADESFSVGDRVRVLTGQDGTTRVGH